MIEAVAPRGKIEEYELNYNHQLKKVLNHFNFKVIELSSEDLVEDRPYYKVNGLVQKALNSFQ